MENKKGGLLPLKPDSRDLHMGAIVTLPQLSELPIKFSLGDTIIRNQEKEGNDDACTAYGTVGMAYLEDGMEGSPEWVFAAGKKLSGSEEEFGQDMRTAFQVWVDCGSPLHNEVKVPDDKTERRYLKNYDPNLTGDVLKKQTYVTCKGPYDAFDNIRASIWYWRNYKRSASIGVVFAWPLEQVYLDTINENGYGHFMFVTGWDGGYLEVVNSYGKEAGENGKHYMSREVVNYYIKTYGSYMMIDIPIGEARALSKKTCWFKWFWEQILK